MNTQIQKLKVRIDTANDQAQALRHYDLVQAQTLLQEAHKLSTTGEFSEAPYHEGLIRSLIGLGDISRISGDLDKAMAYLTEASQLSDATGLLRAAVSASLGSIHNLLGDLFRSAQAYEQALSTAGQDAERQSKADALIGMSNIYAAREEYSTAVGYLREGLELSNQLQYLAGQLRATNNLASIYQLMGQYDDALVAIEQAFSLTDDGTYILEEIFIFSTAGEIQSSLGSYGQALEFLQQALRLSEEYSIRMAEPGILVNISKIYRAEQRTELETEVLHQAIKASEELRHLGAQQVCHQRLSEIYEHRGEFEAALRHHKQFHTIREIIFSDAAEQKLKDMQALHETETHKQQAEIARLKNAELLKAKEAVEAANLARSAFFANMSHELRTPINVILGFAQLMQFDATLSPTNLDNLNTIVRSGRHLLDLINEVLDMSKIEAEKMTVRRSAVSLYQLLDELETMFDFRVKEKGLAFAVDCNPSIPMWVTTDERKLRQVLLNLIGNAIKFTEVGHVHVRANYAEGRLYFEVEDTGQGIAEADLNRLFTPFQQAERQGTQEQGTGLGLAISQAFVRLMGDSSITVSSALNKGSVFRFDIPVESAEDPIPADAVPHRRVKTLTTGQPLYRILVADDDTDGRTALVRLLRLVGFDVQQAVDGSQAVSISREWQPHMIFMDLRMPEMDGVEAARQIKRFAPTMVMVAMSANVFSDDQADDALFDGFMLKPLRNELLLETIAQHINVQYDYDNTEGLISSPFPDTEHVHELLRTQPLLWRQKMFQFANAGNKKEILALVEAIQRPHKELADTIQRWMKEYRLDKLLALLEQQPDIMSADSAL